MAKNKQRGRPKTSKGNRVRVSIMLDPDLVDWSRDKRSDMVNRLLRLQKGISDGIDHEIGRRRQGLTPILLDGEAEAILSGQPSEAKLNGLVDDRRTLIDANNILKLLSRGKPKRINDGNENDPV